MPYKLVHDYISRDVIEACAVLYEGAKSGDVKGIAFAAMLRHNRYITNVAGLAFRNPTFARGCVMTLGDEIAGLIHGRDSQETR
ncbi:hypothetical protein [Variovorax sp. PBL-E5]|uniref:hypothetical protein n=1 Tax=Variovorax sp. PBL-E5 TaxID=434014 RepID=UPI001317946A|nr:hypothetical protein [Variovorax sp. PBL-E5]VTU37106.1 hypothetical protein E5CHR_04487 [Variovorax sp. PBL-E5]